jgi:hypothetical protein
MPCVAPRIETTCGSALDTLIALKVGHHEGAVGEEAKTVRCGSLPIEISFAGANTD